MTELNSIDGWEKIDPATRDDISDRGEAWRETDNPSEEIIIDRSDPDEPRDWKVMFPDGRRRFSRSRAVVVALADLYMRTGSF